MSDSDGDFVAEDVSDDDFQDHQLSDEERHAGGTGGASSSHTGTRGSGGGRSTRRKRGPRKKAGRTRAAWEDVKRSWEAVTEGEDGNLEVAERLEAEKRRRLLRDTTPLQRGIIRHLMLVVDMSFAMAEKDLLPTRQRIAWKLTAEFVREYFEQNPISQMGILGMKDGVAVRISEMGGNPAEHLEQLKKWKDSDPLGSPSLQNALEMCRGALFHTPSHGTREVLVIYGALLSSDPGDIHDTISNLVSDRIRVSVVGLSAQVAICEELCSRTNAGDESQYNVAMDEMHFRELFLRTTTPPVTRTQAQHKASLLMMGFPSRTLAPADTTAYCACHNKPVQEGYLCTRCGTRVCRLPVECSACELTLILSTHLARSYHHLFPLRNWVEVPWTEAGKSKVCYSCLTPFPDLSKQKTTNDKTASSGKAVNLDGSNGNGSNSNSNSNNNKTDEENGEGSAKGAGKDRADGAKKKVEFKGVSESGRYACEVCGNHFCIDCDVYAHEVIHNCPGCQGDTRPQGDVDVPAVVDGADKEGPT